MSTDVPSSSTMRSEERKSSWAFGLTLFAVTMLAVSGVWQAIAGFSALLHDEVYVTVVGVVFAGAGMATNFLLIPLQPYWSLLIIVLDAAVIWALSTSARPDVLMREPTDSRYGRAG